MSASLSFPLAQSNSATFLRLTCCELGIAHSVWYSSQLFLTIRVQCSCLNWRSAGQLGQATIDLCFSSADLENKCHSWHWESIMPPDRWQLVTQGSSIWSATVKCLTITWVIYLPLFYLSISILNLFTNSSHSVKCLFICLISYSYLHLVPIQIFYLLFYVRSYTKLDFCLCLFNDVSRPLDWNTSAVAYNSAPNDYNDLDLLTGIQSEWLCTALVLLFSCRCQLTQSADACSFANHGGGKHSQMAEEGR